MARETVTAPPAGESYRAMTDGDTTTLSSTRTPMADATYVPDESGAAPQRAEPVQQHTWYATAVPDTPKKKAVCTSCCCCVLLLFLLLFFLIPRGPRVTFEKLTLYYVSGVAEQDLKFHNSNFYDLGVESVYLEAGAKGDDGEYYFIGSLESEDDFSVGSLDAKTRTYAMKLEPTAATRLSAKCISEGEVDLLWQGTIDMKALSTGYDDYNIGPWYVRVTCTDDG